MPLPSPSLEERLRRLSRELCAALCAVIHGAFEARDVPHESPIRPVRLTSTLGLDKSLASRVARALSSDDELRALHSIPTPQGLSIIAAAALEAGADAAALGRLGAVTEDYRALLAEFSGGRSDLEATLAGWIPEQRARADREARRSVFRGMTTLSGTRASAIYNALYVMPSEDGEHLDSVVVGVRQDLRKLRSDASLVVVGLRTDPERVEPTLERQSVAGRPLEEDPAAIVLPDLCSHPIPPIAAEEWRDELVVGIADDALDVNEFTTLGFAWRTKRHFPSVASESLRFDHLTSCLTRPTEALVVDLFVHRDAGWITPQVTFSAEGRAPRRRAEGPGEEAPVPTDLERAPGGLASAHVRACPAIAETVCREAGLERGDFRAYRACIELPVPGEELTLWWPRRTREPDGSRPETA